MGDINQNFSVFNIDTKGLEKPTVLLIEKLSKACGATAVGLAQGGQYLHDTAKILNSSDVSDSLKQVLSWDMVNKIREYTNVNEIVSRAVGRLSSKASEEKIHQMDDDWIAYVMKQAAMVSDDAMQDVWAKLISGEAESPGRFSRRAVNIVSIMDKKDAELFTVMGQFITDETPSSKRELLIYGAFNDVYTKQGVDYNAILHFQSLGLIHHWENSYSVYHKQPKVVFCYRGLSLEVSLPLADDGRRYEFKAGKVSLTSAGREVLSLAESKYNPEFWEEYVIERWRKMGIIPAV